MRGTTTASSFQVPKEIGRHRNDFVIPIVHIHLPEPALKLGLYGGLGAAVALSAVDWPLAVIVGAGVAIARHQRA